MRREYSYSLARTSTNYYIVIYYRSCCYIYSTPYIGSLSLTERAQVSNWFEANISRDKKNDTFGLDTCPLHIHILYILLKVDPKYATLGNWELISKAWNVQFSGTPSVLQDVDIDRDCLETLEEEMFEKSACAGIAGHWQWGLDPGATSIGIHMQVHRGIGVIKIEREVMASLRQCLTFEIREKLTEISKARTQL